MNLLALAFYLSVLSYALGLLVKSLPIPFISVKRLGKSLVNEGVFSATLTFSYQLILSIVDYLGGILGSNWNTYTNWLLERSLHLVTYLSVLRVIGIGFSRTGLGFITQSFINPVANLITTSLISVTLASIISAIIYSSAGHLVALGVVFHAVPFKLTRSVGATIIAMTIVFSIGLPLMPTFIDLLMSATAASWIMGLGSYCTADIKLVDMAGNALGQAVIEGYSSEGELLYRYIVDRYGYLSVNKLYGYPCESHTALVYVADQVYLLNIPSMNQDKTNLSIHIPNILSIEPNRFVLTGSNIRVLNTTRSNKTISFVVYTWVQEYLRLYTERSDTVFVYINETAQSPSQVDIIERHGVNYTVYSYQVSPGVSSIRINIDYVSTTQLGVDEYSYTAWLLNREYGGIDKLVFFGTYIFMEFTVLPLVYLSILVMVSLSVARLLGGAYSSLVKHAVNL